jgi:hypothetical protein
MAVVKKTVQDRRRDHGIAKHSAPLAHGSVRGHQDRATLITAADQLKEQVRGVGLKRQITELVHDRELRL